MLVLRIAFILSLLFFAPASARQPAAVKGRGAVKPCRAVPAPQPIHFSEVPPTKHHVIKPLVMIDPGHGGKDIGAVSLSKPVYQEKNLNLASARFLEQFLRQRGYRTLMTRDDDTFLTLEERADVSKEKKAQLFVSVHFNSAPNKTAEGIEVFYYKSDKDKERSNKSEALAKAVLANTIETTQANSRGIKHGNFSVIRNSSIPAILIEGGFLTNDSEMERIKDPTYLKKLAWGIAQGIDQYIKGQSKS